ncbi:PEGA domain-containing protein [bacterium]|nr:MAG: PEGA domain-containing protein [bacterium]
MDKTTRYLILVFIFIVFLALAPLIVLYVSGRNFSFNDFSNGTGILDIQSEPSDAQVTLNGNPVDNTPSTVRFIKQGNYALEVKKAGYHTWRKELFIEAGKVTYAGHLNDSVKLLPDQQPVKITDGAVIAMQVVDNNLIYTQSNGTATVYSLNEQKVTRTAQLKQGITHLGKALNNNFILARTGQEKLYVLDVRTLILTELPEELILSQNIELISNQDLLIQRDTELLAYTIASSNAPRLVTKNIRAFTTNGNTVYIATPGTNGIETYLWDGETLSLQNILFAGAIENGKNTELYLTAHKELFLKVDRSLFRINNRPELINNQVEQVSFNAVRQQLTYKTPAEIYFYNFASGLPELFHRSTATITRTFVIPELGYGFIAIENNATAIEIDKRNGQNQYNIFKDAAIADMALSGNENQLVILADQTLYTIVVNN